MIFLNFADRCLIHSSVLEGQLARQRVRACPVVFLCRIGAIPHFLPCNHNIATVRHRQILRRIEIKARIQFLDIPDIKVAGLKIQFADECER